MSAYWLRSGFLCVFFLAENGFLWGMTILEFFDTSLGRGHGLCLCRHGVNGSLLWCYSSVWMCVCSKAAADAAVLPYLRIIMELVKRQFHMATLVKKSFEKTYKREGWLLLRVFNLKCNFLLLTLYNRNDL